MDVNENDFIVTKAARKAVPMLISLSGTSGSGKTFSGLSPEPGVKALLAAPTVVASGPGCSPPAIAPVASSSPVPSATP